jgi:hypothetical protein
VIIDPKIRLTASISALALALYFASPLHAASDATTLESSNDSSAEEESSDKQSGKWGNLLPLPIIVTEPAIGNGLGATLIYFHKEDEKKAPVSTARNLSKTGERQKPPPTASGIFGFYTDNDTYAFGIGHSNSFADDHYRLRAALAEARVNSTFYVGDRPLDFRIEGNLLFADLKTRLGDSGVFFGLSTSYTNASSKFVGLPDPIGSLLDFNFVDTGVAASLIYDTRDNTILPTDGYHIELIGWRHDEALGGDFNYSTARLKALWFTPLSEKYVLGARLDSSTADGDPPYFAFPFVRLRGIPALRYQGEVASAFELEGRRRIGDRWTASLFAGVGSIRVGKEQVETEDEIRTIGIGTRYLAYREQDAWVGVDVARGPEDVVVYIQMGSSW